MKSFSVSVQEIKMSKRGVRLMNVGIIEVVIEIVKVWYEVGVFTVCQMFRNSTFTMAKIKVHL